MVDLAFCSPGEAQNLLPEALENVQQFGNCLFLLVHIFTQCLTADMDMQPAGSRCVAAVAHAAQGFQRFPPRHLL